MNEKLDNNIIDNDEFLKKIKDDIITVDEPTSSIKWASAIIAAIIAFIIFNPFTFKLINTIFIRLHFPKLLSENGVPNSFGMIFNTLLYLLILRLIMG